MLTLFMILTIIAIPLFFKPKLSIAIQGFSSVALFIYSAILLIKGRSVLGSFFNSGIPFLHFSINLDALSLLFIMIISTISFGVAVYSLNYLFDEDYHHKRVFAFIYTAFTASLIFVVSSANAFSFLVFWEIMSTLSFFLVIYDFKKEENRSGGFIYIFMTHLGTAFIIAAFVLIYLKSGSFDFDSWHHITLDPITKFFVFLFVLLGFGTKAGIFPLHVWLPHAHPVAPSNISALMSGVMIKTAIYMFIRFYFYFFDTIPWWYGFIVLILGALSALFGVMYALAQHDLKKLLAYHSIENIGIILLGLGSGMMFYSYHYNVLAAFAILAALFHTYNHALFKSLLFMGAGSVLLKTHTKDMEKYGGLIKLMPFTSLFFIIGSISISALPPFNGFVSEWLTYQSLLLSNKIDLNAIHVFMPLFASMLALTGAFAAACFVKVIGISFLGKSRSKESAKSSEVGKYMVYAMGFLAMMCALFGLFPNIVVDLVSPVTHLLFDNYIGDHTISKAFIISTPDYSFGKISTIGLLIAGLFAGGIIYLMLKRFGILQTRICSTWGCGQKNITPRSQYSASGFSQPIRQVFANFYHPKEKTYTIENKKKYFFPKMKYEAHSSDFVEKLYNLLTKAFMKSSLYLYKKIENGSTHIYILYIFIMMITLLFFTIRGN